MQMVEEFGRSALDELGEQVASSGAVVSSPASFAACNSSSSVRLSLSAAFVLRAASAAARLRVGFARGQFGRELGKPCGKRGADRGGEIQNDVERRIRAYSSQPLLCTARFLALSVENPVALWSELPTRSAAISKKQAARCRRASTAGADRCAKPWPLNEHVVAPGEHFAETRSVNAAREVGDLSTKAGPPPLAPA